MKNKAELKEDELKDVSGGILVPSMIGKDDYDKNRIKGADENTK